MTDAAAISRSIAPMATDGGIIVFGGGGAIGGAVVECLLSRGVSPVLATYHSAPGREHAGVEWVGFDAKTGDGRDAVRKAVQGICRPLRGVVYAVGLPSSKRSIVDTDLEEWRDTFAVNTLGFVNAYAAVHDVARHGRARVVALGSDTTWKVGPTNGPYTAAKVALEAVVLTLAREEARFGVRVNLLAPSLVDTPLAAQVLRLKGVDDLASYAATQPWGRLLTTVEVAEVVTAMVVDSAWDYATGQVVRLASSA